MEVYEPRKAAKKTGDDDMIKWTTDMKEMRQLRNMLVERYRDMKEWGCTREHIVNGRSLKNRALIDYLHDRIEFLSEKIENDTTESPTTKRRQAGPARGQRGGSQ